MAEKEPCTFAPTKQLMQSRLRLVSSVLKYSMVSVMHSTKTLVAQGHIMDVGMIVKADYQSSP